jgi:hypothetical protein
VNVGTWRRTAVLLAIALAPFSITIIATPQ